MLSVTSSPFFLHQDESLQTEEEPSLSLALAWLQSVTWARAQPKWELAHEWEGLARKYKDQHAELFTKHENLRAMMAVKLEEWQARMEEEVDATFQEVIFWNKFNHIGQAASLVHLHCHQSWCSSHMLNEWGAGYHHAMKSRGGPLWLPLLQSLQTEIPTLPILPPWNIPLISTPPVGC